MSSLQLAATFTAVALGLLVGPLQELGERSAMYHDMVKIPGTSPAWMPLTAFSTQVRVRDDQDPQHRWWRSHFKEIFGTLVIFLAISRGVDLILLRWSTKVSARWAVRIHAVLDIFLSTVFLWKLYGFFFWIVAAQTMINYVIVVAGRSTSSHKMRVAALATVWALNIGLVLNSRQVQDYVYDATRHYETLASIHPFVRFLKLFNLGPGGLQWHSNMRFVLFRVIDFATSELLRGAGGAAPSSKEVIQGKRRKAPLLPEWLAVLRYAMYAPLVWQGPIIGYRAFCIQTQRRYRVINGRLRVAPVPWRKSFILAGKLVSAVLVREFLDHHWFASMFTHRHVHKQMRSCETAAAMLVLFLSAYMRMLLTWRYFRLWALLDGIEVTDNFPRCAFRNTSVGDMWRNMNASVHIWLLGNIYGPVCDVFKFHRRWGVVATFVFMAFWHGMFPAWVMFAAVNAVLVLLEQEALETTPPQAKQLEMSRTRVLFGRAFVDESVNETIARDFGISNLERNDGLAWKVLQWTCALTCAVAGVVIPLAVGILLSYIKLKTKKVKRQNVWLPDAEWKDETDSSGLTHWLEYVLATAAILLGLRLLFGVFAFSQSELRNKAPVTESASSRAISWHLVGLGPKRGWPRFFGCSAVTKARLPPECAWASDPNAVAYLQYTSGSTGNPKGVRITHGNIMEQGFQNQLAFGCTGRGETAVNWCPQYHDLGLVVCILSGVFAGIRLVSFSPLAFMRDPLLWVRAISTYRASFSAAPNFAYGYAARKARAAAAAGEALSGLDLSCWRIAGNGGEPVRAQTLDAFANAFERFGFSRSAAFPCYGLAEHTIMVSGRSSFRPPTLLRVNRAALAQHRVEVMNCNVGFDSTQSSSSSSSKEAVVLVGCGDAYEGVEVRIVDPDTGRAFTSSHQEERVGEIWLRSHSVADGYWANPQATKEVFLAKCASADSEGVSETGEREVTFLRTGDLGFVRNGELFICGRCKDLIIVDGRNIYPQDVESTAEQAHQALRPGSSAAFANESGVVLVAELRREAGQSGETVVRRACQMAYKHVLNEQRVSLSEVIVVDAGVLPKTSSGKIRRRAVAALVNAQDATLARATRFQGRAADLALFEDSESATDTDVGMAFGDLLLDPTYASIVECIMVAGTLAASKQEVLQAQAQEQEQNEGQEQEQKQLQSVDELRDIRHEEAGQLDEEVLQKSLDEVLMGADGGKSSFSSLEAVQFAAGLEARLQQCGVDLTLPPDIAFRHPNVGALALYIHDASSM
ncbi:4-coumarate--CoA ligase 4 [Hondaea fermentalgiana]|uniref:4-coumarate--CoA ligase 4 n=1 Tax=Hondaea fermentalgiana TaxID=2315210 RepID=A0A2R5GPS4_9STRA|nr:4-coumarate--CoA ligase 4 [Hondaea fermentalgiana]|eukprot:GBG31778.1 4-coumarate--CoA ligase 4 [Hondaea fermentalgiana]